MGSWGLRPTFKVQLRDYYDDAGTSGFPKFRWAEIEPPDEDIEVEVLDGGTPVGDGGGEDAHAGGQGDFGCYDPDTHACDCETDEATCGGRSDVWTDGCGC